jgi:RimJ/RimL family protein N-acetyltransferase
LVPTDATLPLHPVGFDARRNGQPMNVVPFKREHMEDLRPCFEGPWISNLSEDHIKIMEELGDTFSGEIKGRILGVAGIAPVWPGVGEAFTFLSPELLQKYKWSMHRAVSRYFEQIVAKHKYHRVQCVVMLGHVAARRWAEAFGFKFEGVMPLYTQDKQTMIRYGKVWV